MKITRAAKRRIYSPVRQVHVAAAGAVLAREKTTRMFAQMMDNASMFGMTHIEASLLQPRLFAEAIRDDIQRLNREVLSEVIADVVRATLPPPRKRG